MFKHIVSGLLAVAACTCCLAQNAPQAVDARLAPYLSSWSLDRGTFTTAGDPPPQGWHLASPRQFDIRRLSLEVKKLDPDGFFYIYTGDLRILFRHDVVRIKRMSLWGPGKPAVRHWTQFWWTAKRPIEFKPGRFYKIDLAFDGKGVNLSFDGNALAPWRSPAREWNDLFHNSTKMARGREYLFPDELPEDIRHGRGQIVVLHALGTGAVVRNVVLEGADTGAAKGFHGPDISGARPYTLRDVDLESIIPHQPVKVTWSLPEAQLKPAARCPAVERFTIERRDKIAVEVGRAVEPMPRLFVGADKPGQFPNELRGPRGWPYGAQVFFNLAKPGTYTLKLDWGAHNMHRGGVPLEVHVDGRPVSRVVYRALNKHGVLGDVSDYTPMELSAGLHRIDLVFSRSLVKKLHFLTKYQKLSFKTVELVPGHVLPETVYKAGHKGKGLDDPPRVGEAQGKHLRYRVTGLDPGKTYTLTLWFHDVDATDPGQRLMDVSVGGKVVLDNWDLVKEAGWNTTVEKTWPVEADKDGNVTFAVRARRFKALLNAAKLTGADPDTVVFHENLAWHPGIARYQGKEEYRPNFGNKPIAEAPPKWTDEQLWDGHNLLPNPHLSLPDAKRPGKPLWWYSARELNKSTLFHYPEAVLQKLAPSLAKVLRQAEHWPGALDFYGILPGSGTWSHDNKTGHDQPGSVRIERTGLNFGLVANWPAIDYGKQQTFSFYAKTDRAAGQVYGEIYWFSTHYHAELKWRDGGDRGEPLPVPRLQLMEVTRGTHRLTGTHDWTRIDVTAKPPYGATYALPVVRVENNTSGTVWIDDAELNGYGSEPLEITVSLAGYHPRSSKRVVVKALEKAPVSWQVVDHKTARPVHTGVAEYHGYEWFSKRHYYIVDLTGFDQPGTYLIKARQGKAAASTRPVSIDADVYRRVSRVALSGIYHKRFNTDMPGFHEPECMEDSHAIVTEQFARYDIYEWTMLNRRKELLGGYYDAGDEMKHMEFWPVVLFACADGHLRLPGQFKSRTGADDLLDEAAWGYRAFAKCLYPDGRVYTRLYPYTNYSENIPLYGTDRWLSSKFALPQTMGVSALGAWVLRERAPELSKQHLEMARANYEYNKLYERADGGKTPGEKMLMASKALLAEVYLHKLTGDQVYARRMAAHARLVAEGMKAGGYRGTFELGRGNNKLGGINQDWVVAAIHFLKHHPEHPEAAGVKEGLRAFAEDVKRVSSIDPWGQARELTTPPGKTPARWPGTGRPIAYWTGLAWSLSQIGLVLGDIEIVRLGERQLQWVLGANLADLSMLHGVGHRLVGGGDKLTRQPEFIERWMTNDEPFCTFDGTVPTMAFRSVSDGRMKLGAGGDWSPPIQGYPQGYYHYYLMSNYPIAPGPSEYYLPLTGQTLMGALGVEEGVGHSKWGNRK